MKDIIFLFGAGASAGAGSILPERPPLGTQLFPELRRLFPGTWGSLSASIQSKLEVNFEDGMAAAAQQIGIAVAGLMRDMAVYFVQFRPVDRRSLYNRLIQELGDRSLLGRTIFSTLNYDCVLEYAALDEGMEIDYFGEGAEGQVPVWKLHGSCNMFSAGLQAGQGVMYDQGVIFEGGIQAWLDQSRVIEHCLVETGLAPVMCQYMEGKPTSISPSAIRELQTRWAQAIASAALVVCVGVRPHPPDTHIWQPLEHSTAHLSYSGDKAIYEPWLATRSTGSASWSGHRFNGAFPNILQLLEGL